MRPMNKAGCWVLAGVLVVMAGCGGGKDKPKVPADVDRDGVADVNDCAPNDGTAWQTLAFAARNDDGDSAKVNVAGSVCTGAALPANRFAAAVPAAEVDCDDTNANVWQGVAFAARN